MATIEPKWPTLSIIGPTKAGKTTLRSRLAFEFSPNTRTQRVSALVVSLQVSPPKYLAIIDGGGEVYAQQFKLAEICDRLCIVLDHNSSDSDPQIDQSRLADQAKFLAQIRHHLDEYKAGPKQWVHLLMNKRDLWEALDSSQSDILDRFCHEEAEKWRHAKHAETIEARRHSNNKPDDIAGFVAMLKK